MEKKHTPRVIDNDRDEITVELDGKEIRGWSYATEGERRTKMLAAREFVEGWYQAEKRLLEAIEPVHHWYQSDEHDPRLLTDIITDVVGDLQSDRADSLKLPKLLKALEGLANNADGLRIIEEEIRAAAGNTNWEVLQHWIEEARAALAAHSAGDGALPISSAPKNHRKDNDMDRLAEIIDTWLANKRRDKLTKKYGGTQICPWCRQCAQDGDGWSFLPSYDHAFDVLKCGVCSGTSLWRFEVGMIYFGALSPPRPKIPNKVSLKIIVEQGILDPHYAPKSGGI